MNTIYLFGCKEINDIGVCAIARNCHLLTSIDLSLCTNITDVGLSAVAHGCPVLDSINLSHCDKITDVGVSAIGYRHSLLKAIGISYCKKVTDKGLLDLVRKSSHLCYINAIGCILISRDINSTLQIDYPVLSIHLRPIGFRSYAPQRYHIQDYEVSVSHDFDVA